MRDETFVADLRAVRARLKDSFSLCEFMGVTEREVMVFQTIRAAVTNLDSLGEPYSVRGSGVFTVAGNGLFDNRSAYTYLVDKGYFDEEDRDGLTLIFPTRKLLNELMDFFGRHSR